MAASIEELLDNLSNEIEDAKNAAFSSDKCVIERDHILELIEDIKVELPVELKRARDLVAQREEYLDRAKSEADTIRQQADDYRERTTSDDVIVQEAQDKADEILDDAEERAARLRDTVNSYCADILARLEDAMADAFDEVKQTRARFLDVLDDADNRGSAPAAASSRRAYDDEEDD